jgi:hypothetical protein
MNTYKLLQEQHQKNWNEFPIFYAFNQEQFNEGIKKIGLNPEDTDKIYSLRTGGFYKKSDSKRLKEMLAKHEPERQEALKHEQYVYEMFMYELSNHEYSYTYELDDTLDALGLTMKEINKNPILKNGLEKAIKKQEQY